MKSKKDLYDTILSCWKGNRVISIKTKNREPLITAIDRVVDKGDLVLIQTKPFTLYGKEINETVIHLEEVEEVVPLFAKYNDPSYVRVREMKMRIK
jgi:hypothetical protein